MIHSVLFCLSSLPVSLTWEISEKRKNKNSAASFFFLSSFPSSFLTTLSFSRCDGNSLSKAKGISPHKTRTNCYNVFTYCLLLISFAVFLLRKRFPTSYPWAEYIWINLPSYPKEVFLLLNPSCFRALPYDELHSKSNKKNIVSTFVFIPELI